MVVKISGQELFEAPIQLRDFRGKFDQPLRARSYVPYRPDPLDPKLLSSVVDQVGYQKVERAS